MPQDSGTGKETHSLYRAHPWHGVSIGEKSPNTVNCYIEIVPTDTVKYELDKASGILCIDRPQRYSSCCPALYGLIPQTYCNSRVAEFCAEKLGTPKTKIKGDGDPLDICVFSDRTIVHGDLLIKAVPIGGFRTLDGDEVDDKIIAVLQSDLVYGEIKNVSDCPRNLIERLRHYFLTYKDCPGDSAPKKIRITDTYGADEAHEVIKRAHLDYQESYKAYYDGLAKTQVRPQK